MLLLIASLGIGIAILYGVVGAVVSLIKVTKEKDDSVRDIPCEKRHWLYGTTRKYPPNHLGMTRELVMMKKLPRCVQWWYGPFVRCVMGYHPDISKVLLSGNDPKSYLAYHLMRSWIGDGLIVSHGEKWRRNRRLLTPVFHFDSLRRYLQCANDATLEMTEKWKLGEGRRSVEMFNDISLMTLDNLLRCMFSYTSGCESGRNHEYLKAVKCITEGLIQRIRNPLYRFDFIYYLTPSGRKYRESLNTVHHFTEKAIKDRVEIMEKNTEHKKPSEYDFLDILMMAKDDNGVGLSHQEIQDELDTFVFGGHDTVTSGLSWAFYNLAVYPNMQELCRDEVLKVLEGRNRVDWEDLPKFEYLTRFIKESMRLYPPVPVVSRDMSRSKSLPDVFTQNQVASQGSSNDRRRTLPKGSMLGLRIFLLHRHPAVWDNPDVFDPERFHPRNVGHRPPHAYVPFSAGPRNCIGQNFAMNLMKVVLAVTLSMFKFRLDEAFPEPRMKNAIILRSEAGIHLIVERL